MPLDSWLSDDAMVLSLLLQWSDGAKKAAVAGKEDPSNEVVGRRVKEGFWRSLGSIPGILRKNWSLRKEQKKHITSEDMHNGFDSKVCFLPRVYQYEHLANVRAYTT